MAVTVIGSNSLQRPNNNVAYASGQMVANAATNNTATALSFVVPQSYGYGGMVINASLAKSNTGTTNAAFRLHLFDATQPTLTNLGDQNSYATPNINDYAAYVGYFDFVNPIAGSNGVTFQGVPSQQPLAFSANTSNVTATLYGVLACQGVYAPGNSETFSVRIITG